MLVNQHLNKRGTELNKLIIIYVIVKNLQWLRYGMDDRGLVVRFSAGGKEIFVFFFQNLQTDSGVNTSSYSTGTRGLLRQGNNELQREADNPTSCRSELKNE